MNRSVVTFLYFNVWIMFAVIQINGRLGISRVFLAMFQRDALPYSHIFKKINQTTKAPINVIIFLVSFTNMATFIILVDKTIYDALGSLGAAGIQISYLVVVILRIQNKEVDFTKCKFNLGKYSLFINYVAAIWMTYSIIAILVPNLYHKDYTLTLKIFNWAPVMVVLEIITSLTYWHYHGKYNTKNEDD